MSNAYSSQGTRYGGGPQSGGQRDPRSTPSTAAQGQREGVQSAADRRTEARSHDTDSDSDSGSEDDSTSEDDIEQAQTARGTTSSYRSHARMAHDRLQTQQQLRSLQYVQSQARSDVVSPLPVVSSAPTSTRNVRPSQASLSPYDSRALALRQPSNPQATNVFTSSRVPSDRSGQPASRAAQPVSRTTQPLSRLDLPPVHPKAPIYRATQYLSRPDPPPGHLESSEYSMTQPPSRATRPPSRPDPPPGRSEPPHNNALPTPQPQSQRLASSRVGWGVRSNRAPGRLEPGKFRLLRFVEEHELSGPLSCTIPGCVRIHCRLDEYGAIAGAPPYISISYSWGDHTLTEDVHLVDHGMFVSVTKNCIEVLKHVRSRRQSIWIDAICINQRDPLDKALQIPIIGHIYYGASVCVAFLGLEDSDSRSLFDYRGGKVSKATLDTFMERRWFSRLWVVQEVLHRQNLVLQCGARTMTWTTFTTMYHATHKEVTLEEGGRQAPRMSLPDLRACYVQRADILPAGIIAKIKSIVRQLVFSSRRSEQESIGYLDYDELEDWMRATTGYGCRDPHDRLYALLSLFSGPIPTLLQPDYNIDIREVKAQLTEFLELDNTNSDTDSE